ncbi:DNA polymerase III subunit gamma/tau [Mitsuokella sp. oral taxon 131]|uniref:DNA polymerase III subunit gamma/tau n=1 Tax=Mitsuokella sp. oral taxon 131 TaxID=1321780 RepID=UPI00058C51FC|nr:DNA polymerase III subunit gamma/tau [Mitsuokella sp. oral taxon 131]
MAYVALYRKWRPGTFSDLVGQDAVSRTLANAIESGRIGHAYLFSGPRGTGKTSTAKILAKGLNCAHGPTAEPCGTCEACKRIADGSSMDVFEIDAASNRGIDEIRDLREKVKFAPVDGRYKVYIIDEVHMLTMEAFNALLKTLEEPPAHVVFILATTEAHKVPATIQSRCQRFDFRRITAEEIRARLAYVAKESGIEAEEPALALIAVQADGGMRDALSILDQCSAVAGGKVTAKSVSRVLGLIGHEWIFRMTRAVAEGRTQEILAGLAQLIQGGKDLRQVLVELTLHLRSLMIFQAAGTVEEMDLYAEPEDVLKAQSACFSTARIMQMIRRLHEALAELKWSPQPRITVEVALLALAQPEMEGHVPPVASAAPAKSGAQDGARLAELEAKVASLSAALSAIPAPKARAPQRVRMEKAAEESGRIPPALAPASPMAPAASHAVRRAPASAEAKEVYARLLKRLEGNPSAHACFQDGKPAGMTESTFTVAFNSSMRPSLARIFSRTVERILHEETGYALRLICTGEDDSPVLPRRTGEKRRGKKAMPAAPKKEFDLDSVAPEERAPLQNAMHILGGTVEVVEVPDDDAPDAPHGADAHCDVPLPDDPPPLSDADAPKDEPSG